MERKALIHRKSMINRLKESAGFTLSELLFTMLIMSVVLAAVSSGVIVLRDVYQKIVLKSEALTLSSTIATAISGDLKTATDIDPADGGAVKRFQSGLRGYEMIYQNGSIDSYGKASAGPAGEGGFDAIIVEAFVDSADGDASTYLPLVTGASYTDKLCAVLEGDLNFITDHTYDAEKDGTTPSGYFQYELKIYARSDTAKADPITEQTFIVRPYNR